MDDAGLILTAYAATFGSILAYAIFVLRGARNSAGRIPDDDKPWR